MAIASFILLLVIASSVPSSLAQCNTEKALPHLRRSVYEFTIELVKRIAEENDNHFVSSALSPWTLISTLSLGAADDTLDEIKTVLRLHAHKCFNKKFFEIIHQLNEAKDGTVLERSSVVFVDNELNINEKFRNRLESSQVSHLQEIVITAFPHTAATTINEYVKQATRGNIDDIVDASDLEDVLIILVDALYFKGSWTTPFLPENTEESAFYDASGNQIGDVNLMFAEIGANIANMDLIGATVLELAYGSGDRFSMLFILPNDENTIPYVLQEMKDITLGTIFKLFNQTGLQKVSVQIPRFKIVSDLSNMKEWLEDMGLRAMFNDWASFPDLTDTAGISVSDLVQKATIEVNEEGSEASAATAGFLSGRSLYEPPVPQFVANKPFLYMIVDRQLELVLFSGAYSKPSIY